MNNVIKDGSGGSSFAKVDSANRLYTFSTIQDEFTLGVSEGEAFSISTGVINLTSANESGVLYFKNLEDRDVIVKELFIQTGISTGGSGDVIRTDYIAPTGGTLISAASAGIKINLNAGSLKTIDMTVYKGVEGSTVSGALASLDSLLRLDNNFVQSTGTILTKGSALAMTITPPTGNTSMNVSVTLTLFISKKLT